MGAWLEAYERLSEEEKDRVQRWIHLNKFIAHTLRLSFEEWFERFVRPAFDRPMDYGFIAALLPDFKGLDVEGQGVSFTREMDPSARAISRVPLRAKNNLGRLSPDLQDRLSAMLEGRENGPLRLLPGDVGALQKILPGEKALAKLPRPQFRKLLLTREEDDVVFSVEGAEGELARLGVPELGAVLARPLV